ncbi:hypothetical protein BH11GEM2_BH11GEM2_21310 [soil metagenome]|jgi:hypothetical protein
MRNRKSVIGMGPLAPRRMRQTALAALMGSLALASACMRNTPEEAAEPVPPTYVRVENRAFLDMNVYLYRSAQRMRLGTTNGNSTARYIIPASMMFGPTPLRFQADPIGGNRQPISQEITVAPGDEVVLVIPPT